ncbi:hypothetical protein GPJ56_008044 [Histomonas meleagridis]|uniref:uncharacterized protein n=1 Tax=Histomonas meleagridis TaxID=135588 RepID=UPI00355A183B|nr:hypothetical protein GPJ56_008044 [Histomonas meleagridis]KAH0804916.1 hypothetical protein GO595_002309 [Histomonas meleagridis]
MEEERNIFADMGIPFPFQGFDERIEVPYDEYPEINPKKEFRKRYPLFWSVFGCQSDVQQEQNKAHDESDNEGDLSLLMENLSLDGFQFNY